MSEIRILVRVEIPAKIVALPVFLDHEPGFMDGAVSTLGAECGMVRASKVDGDKAAMDNLMLAASRVVGRKGYKGASIARIAEEAEISIGQCYKFFPSRDSILENLILWILDKFEDFAEKNLSKAKNYIEFEHEALDQYFRFQKKYPFFITILRDSEVETPETWLKFSDQRFVRYVKALSDAFDRGEVVGFDRDQIPHISQMLSSMRRNIVFRYPDSTPDRKIAIRTYDTFVRQALGLRG